MSWDEKELQSQTRVKERKSEIEECEIMTQDEVKDGKIVREEEKDGKRAQKSQEQLEGGKESIQFEI